MHIYTLSLAVSLGAAIAGSRAAPLGRNELRTSDYTFGSSQLTTRAQACDAPTTCDDCCGSHKFYVVVKSAKEKTVEEAAELAFTPAIQKHVFEGDNPNDLSSGRHLLTVWTAANKKTPAKVKPSKLGKLTGLVEFEDGDKKKTVWNDAPGTGETEGVPEITLAQAKTMCLSAYQSSILANSANQAGLKLFEAPPPAAEPVAASSSRSKKPAKVKAPPKPPTASQLKIIPGKAGDDHGFVVLNTAVTPHQLVCINVLETSCYPLGVNPVKAGLKAGDSCSAQDTNIED
uniref:Uncharacterized protein n=1 Tax=Mycena chlorophos TaxID=658473 RepID=A0ABQ0LPR8_MYCCL|nr:predicted protein [Mycena chlorophos]